jgi:hypothetical protein
MQRAIAVGVYPLPHAQHQILIFLLNILIARCGHVSCMPLLHPRISADGITANEEAS